MPEVYWQEILDVYTVVLDDYFVQIISAFVGTRGTENSKAAKVLMVPSARTGSYQFQTALQIARTSYEREALPLDELSWDRIQACADAFFTYFEEILREGNTLRIPLLTMRLPKKLGEERMKSIYVHERLILQQYVLNVAFANGSGGRIVFGVENGMLKVGGVNQENVFTLMDGITSAICDSCTPMITPIVMLASIEEKVVIVVNIMQGGQRPY